MLLTVDGKGSSSIGSRSADKLCGQHMGCEVKTDPADIGAATADCVGAGRRERSHTALHNVGIVL